MKNMKNVKKMKTGGSLKKAQVGGTVKKRTAAPYSKDSNAPLGMYLSPIKPKSGNRVPARKTGYGNTPLQGTPIKAKSPNIPLKKKQTGGVIKKKALLPAPVKKTGTDALKGLVKYVSTFGGATERDNPKQKDINIVKKLKETIKAFQEQPAVMKKQLTGKKYGGSTTPKKTMGGSMKYKMGGAMKTKKK